MLNIVYKDFFHKKLDIDTLRKKFHAVLKLLQISDSEVTIAFVSNGKLRELKRIYLGIDKTTDVLSFRNNEINPETGKNYLGDIVISLEEAYCQAKNKNHTFEFEVLTLFIHGLLHLLNYDHSNELETKTMFDRQNEILEVINKK